MTTTTSYGNKNPTLFSIVTTNYAAQTNYPLSVVVTGNNTNNTCTIQTGSACSVQITLTASYAGGNGQAVTYSWSSDNYLIFIDPSTNQTTTTGQQVLINNYKTEGVYSYAITCTATQGTNTATTVFYWKSTHTKPPVVATISRVANAPTTCTYDYNTGSTISSTPTCEVLDQWEAIVNEQQSPAGTASYLWSWNNLQAPSGFSLVNTTNRIVTVKSTGVSGGYTVPAGSLKCTITKGTSTTTFSNISAITHSHYAKYYPYATPNIESNSQQWGSIDSDATVFVKYLKNAEWFTPSNTIIYPLPVDATWSRTGIDTGDNSNYATSGTVNSSGQISALSPVLKSFTSFSMIYTISMPQYTLLANTDSNGKFKHTWVGKQLQWSKPSLLDPDYVEGQSIIATLDISNNNYDSTLNKISSDGNTLYWHLFQFNNGSYTKLNSSTRFTAVYGTMGSGTNQGNNLFRYIPNPAITSQDNSVTNTAETFAIALYAGTAVANRTWANAAATSGNFTLRDNNYTFSADNVTDWDAGTRNINSEITRTITVSNFGFSGKIAVRVFAQSNYVLTNPIDVEIRVDDWYASQNITSGGTSYTSYKTYDVTPATASFNIPIGLTIKQAGQYRGNITLTTYNTGSTIVGDNYSFNWVIDTAEASDVTPNAYDFTNKTGQEISTVVESNEITISGLNAATPVSITTTDPSFQYILRQASTATNPESKSTGWISSDRNIRNGDTIKLRLTTSGSYAASKVMNVTIGTVTDTWTVTTRAADTSPSGFTWVNNVTDAELNTDYDAQYVVAGVDSGVNIPLNKAALTSGITFVGTLLTETWNGSSYGALTERSSLPVNVQLNDRITLRIRSSGSYSTAVGCSVTLGDKEAGRTVLTKAQPVDRNPDAFSFTAQTELTLNTTYNSNVITPSGFTHAADISVSGTGSPQYKIYNSSGVLIQDWTSTAGSQTFVPGYQVQLQATTSANYGTSRIITLTIGTTSGTWTITSTPDYYPDVFSFTALSNQQRNTVVTSNEVTIGGLTASGDTGVAASIQIIPNGLSIRVKPINGVYSAWSTSTLWATNGTTIQAQLTTSASYSTQVSGTVQAGFNTAVSFIATTEPEPQSWTLTPTATTMQENTNQSLVIDAVFYTTTAPSYSLSADSANITFSAATGSLTQVEPGNYSEWRKTITITAGEVTANTNVTITVSSGSIARATKTITVTNYIPPDTTPDTFSIDNVTNAELSTSTTSSTTVTITGINAVTNITSSNCEFNFLDVNGNLTGWGTTAQLTNGTKFKVRMTSSSSYSTAVNGSVTVGGVTANWSVTTKAEPPPPPPPATITAISWNPSTITVGGTSTFNVTFNKSTSWHWEIRDSGNQQVYTRPAWGGPSTSIAESYTFNTAGTYNGNAAAQNPAGTPGGASITVNPPPPAVVREVVAIYRGENGYYDGQNTITEDSGFIVAALTSPYSVGFRIKGAAASTQYAYTFAKDWHLYPNGPPYSTGTITTNSTGTADIFFGSYTLINTNYRSYAILVDWGGGANSGIITISVERNA